MRAIVLAAGVGRRFGRRTKRLPKCLIPLGCTGQTLLSRYLGSFRSLGLRDVVIVVGHRKDLIRRACRENGAGLKIRFVVNRLYRKGSIVSLFAASRHLSGDCVIMDADVYFPTPLLKRLIRSRSRTAFLIDSRSKSSGEEMILSAQKGRPVHISKQPTPELRALGEATGFFKVGRVDTPKLKRILSRWVRSGRTGVEYEEAYNDLMAVSKVGVCRTGDTFWTEMDFEEDLEKILRAEKIRP